VKNLIAIGALVIVAVAFILVGVLRKGGGDGELVIGVIPKGTTHDFWNSVHAGAKKAAGEVDVKISWIGSERDDDRIKQIEIIEDLITRKVSGIVVAPIDENALVPVIEKVHDKGIPCVVIDSAVNTEKYVCFAVTDNYKGGVLGARRMGKILDGKGKILVIKYSPGSASTTKRENGFMDTIAKEFPEIEILEHKYGLNTVETALQAAEDLLTKYADVDGIFACNQTTTEGALQALKQQGRADKIKLVGFDSGELLTSALRDGVIDSLVVQNPFEMGYFGVKAVVAKIRGEDVVKKYDTGVELVTQENIDTPKIKTLLGEE